MMPIFCSRTICSPWVLLTSVILSKGTCCLIRSVTLLVQLESLVGLPFCGDLGFIASTDGPFLKTETRPSEALICLSVRETSYRGAKSNPGIKAPECQRYHVSSVSDEGRDDGIQTFFLTLLLVLFIVGESST